MRTIHSRTYTNVALSVLILLLAAMVIRPYLPAPAAYAADTDSTVDDRSERNAAQRARLADLNPNADNAAAEREIAAANKEIASAIRESAKAQQEIGAAIRSFSQLLAGK